MFTLLFKLTAPLTVNVTPVTVSVDDVELVPLNVIEVQDELAVTVKLAPLLIVRAAHVVPVKVTVFVLEPSPMVTLGFVPEGVRAPMLTLPVNRIVPAPVIPLVVVPELE